MKAKHQFRIRDASQDRQPEIQSSSVEETLQRIMGPTNKDCGFSDLHFDTFPKPATCACWKKRFKTEVCTSCSQFPTEAMLWIKDVELVDAVELGLRHDSIQEFGAKWAEILLSMTQIPSDDTLDSLYKPRIRESEKFKTVMELYNVEIHQKKAGHDYHRLKTMVKRRDEQDLRRWSSQFLSNSALFARASRLFLSLVCVVYQSRLLVERNRKWVQEDNLSERGPRPPSVQWPQSQRNVSAVDDPRAKKGKGKGQGHMLAKVLGKMQGSIRL